MDHYDWMANQAELDNIEYKESIERLENKLEPKEALECLIDELLWSKNSIDLDYIACYLRILARRYGINEPGLNDKSNLCIDHYLEKYRREDSVRALYQPRIDRLKENVIKLKDELCGMAEIRMEKAQQSLNDICADLCLSKSRISIERKGNIEFYDFMFERQFPRIMVKGE